MRLQARPKQRESSCRGSKERANVVHPGVATKQVVGDSKPDPKRQTTSQVGGEGVLARQASRLGVVELERHLRDLVGMAANAGDLPPSTRPSAAALRNAALGAVMRSCEGKGKGVVAVQGDESVVDAMKKMAQHALLAVPVLLPSGHPRAADASERWPHVLGKPNLLGFVDVQSLLSKFMEFRRDQHRRNEGWRKSLGEDEEDFMDSEEVVKELEDIAASEQFLHLKSADVVGNDGTVLYQLQEDANLFQVVQDGFFQGNPGTKQAIHRLAVFNASGNIYKMISQSDVLRFILHYGIGGLHETMEEDVESLDMVGKRGLITVPENLIVIECFAYMIRQNVSGVAVVDATGTLIGNLSASDLRCILPEHFGVLAMPVVEFLALLYPESEILDGKARVDKGLGAHPFFDWSKANSGTKAMPLVTCSKKSSLKEVMQLMSENHVHRVYIVDSFGKPLSVVTVTDVLHAFVRKEKAFFGEMAS